MDEYPEGSGRPAGCDGGGGAAVIRIKGVGRCGGAVVAIFPANLTLRSLCHTPPRPALPSLAPPLNAPPPYDHRPSSLTAPFLIRSGTHKVSLAPPPRARRPRRLIPPVLTRHMVRWQGRAECNTADPFHRRHSRTGFSTLCVYGACVRAR